MLSDFFNCESDRIVLEKELTSISAGADIVYKEDTNLVKPTFICRSSDVDPKANYVYVYAKNSSDTSIVNRFYFIDEMTFSQQKVYLHCSIDPLMSFHKDILDLWGIVDRNAVRYNLYLNDDKLKCFNKTRIETFPFKTGFLVNGEGGATKTANLILTISGGGENI